MSLIKKSVNTLRDIDQVDALNKNLGQAVFKNTNGVINNAAGRSDIAKARLFSDYTPTNNDQAAELKSKGYLDLGQIIDEETITSIQDQYADLIESEESYVRQEHDGEVYSRSINQIHERIPELGELLTDDVKEIVRDYYGSYISVKHLNAWRNYHAPDEVLEETEIYSDSWHCDGMVTNVVKLFVNLSDVTEADGPFHILSRDSSRKLLSKGYERNREEMPDEYVSEDEIVRATGSAGTAMLCTTWNCYHRAGHIAAGNDRDIVQFQFVPATEPLPDSPAEWIPQVQTHPSEKRS